MLWYILYYNIILDTVLLYSFLRDTGARRHAPRTMICNSAMY